MKHVNNEGDFIGRVWVCGTFEACGMVFDSIDCLRVQRDQQAATIAALERERDRLRQLCAVAAGACIGLQFHDTMESVKPRLEELRATLQGALRTADAGEAGK